MTMIRRLFIGLGVGALLAFAAPASAARITTISEEEAKPPEPAVPLPVQAMLALQKAWTELKPTIPHSTTNKEIGEFWEIVMHKVLGTGNPVFIMPDGTQVRYLGVGEDHQRVVALFVAVNKDTEPKQIIAVIWEGQSV